jgi:fibronectin type 3 domain-containing protein
MLFENCFTPHKAQFLQFCSIKRQLNIKETGMKHLLVILILACAAQLLSAQNADEKKSSKLVLVGKRQGAQNTLRWTGVDYVSWQDLARTGAVLERYTLEKGRSTLTDRQILSPQGLKPAPIEQWKTRFTAQDTAAGAAAQAMFGKAIPVTQGDPFEAIVALEMQQGMMYGIGMLMADWRPDLADAMALRFEDKNIDPQKTYLYRLYTAESGQTGADTAVSIVWPADKWRAPVVTDLRAYEMEKVVQLNWTHEGNLYAPSGYFIERSADGGKTFVRLNRQPYIKITTKESEAAEENRIVFTDSIGVNYRPYLYRVLAFNAFGEIGPVEKTIKAMGRDRTPPAPPVILSPQFTQGIGLKISWEMAETSDLKGFMVAHSNHAEGPFMPLHNGYLPADARSFNDPTAQAKGLVNYYLVTAVDTANNAMSSLPRHHYFDDTTPPAVPTELNARIDSTGLLTLTWKPNTEPDFMGYNVFFANSAEHTYTQLNGEPLKSDTFVRKLNLATLTEEIFYKVVAMDEAFNPSDFSAPLRVKKPDILPPAPPLIQNMGATEHAVVISWAPSPSNDAVKSEIYRRKSGSNDWQRIVSLPQSAQMYTDTFVEIGQLYEYCLRAIDDDGLISAYSDAHSGRAYPSATGPGLRNFEAKQEKDQAIALLSWQFKGQADAKIYLYRAYNDGQLQLFTTLDGSKQAFSDTQVQSGRRYQYAAKVVYSSGAESNLSPPAMIVFK